jgi:hypothetical protein
VSEFEEEARNRHDIFERGMATRPDPALLLAMLEAPADHHRESVDGGLSYTSPRRPVMPSSSSSEKWKGFAVYSEYIFETTEGKWQLRGGSGDQPRPAFTISQRITIQLWRSSGSPLSSGAGRTRRRSGSQEDARVRRRSPRGPEGSVTFDIVLEESGWFHVILEGSEAAAITAVGADGTSVVDRDGLPVALRLEPVSEFTPG